MKYQEPNPDEGSVEMRNGGTLFWERNAAGGRTYWSDEIGGGVTVWDTCLVSVSTLCEAIAMDEALLGVERRAEERKEREARRQQVDPNDDGTYAESFGQNDKPIPRVTHPWVTLKVHLIRARDQLLRYSAEDPMAAEINKLIGPA